MKIIDAIHAVKGPENSTCWEYSADIEAICRSLDVPEVWEQQDKVDERLRQYPLATWMCTDTVVGLFAIWFDGRPVASSCQLARKSDKQIKWVSEQDAYEVQQFLLSVLPKPEVQIIDPTEEFGSEYWNVAYVCQCLTDYGYYQNRPVRILIRYDGLMGRETKPEHRREGHSYYIKVPLDDPRSGKILIQDGVDLWVIAIEELQLPFEVNRS